MRLCLATALIERIEILGNVCCGSNASVKLSWHVGFNPDFGRMVATHRTDASGQEETHAQQQIGAGQLVKWV
jgi:hypothetical protein